MSKAEINRKQEASFGNTSITLGPSENFFVDSLQAVGGADLASVLQWKIEDYGQDWFNAH